MPCLHHTLYLCRYRNLPAPCAGFVPPRAACCWFAATAAVAAPAAACFCYARVSRSDARTGFAAVYLMPRRACAPRNNRLTTTTYNLVFWTSPSPTAVSHRRTGSDAAHAHHACCAPPSWFYARLRDSAPRLLRCAAARRAHFTAARPATQQRHAFCVTGRVWFSADFLLDGLPALPAAVVCLEEGCLLPAPLPIEQHMRRTFYLPATAATGRSVLPPAFLRSAPPAPATTTLPRTAGRLPATYHRTHHHRTLTAHITAYLPAHYCTTCTAFFCYLYYRCFCRDRFYSTGAT